MPFTRRVLYAENSRRTELLSTIVSNSLPVVGVGLFDWSAAALLFLYWFELGVDSVWALVRAVFAGRPPDIETSTLLMGPLAERQFALSVPRTGLRVYLTTLLALPITVLILAVVWLFTGGLLIGPLPEPSTETVTGVLLATIGIFVLTGITTVRNYFYNGEYRKHNSTTAFRGLLPRIVTVFFGGILTLALITAATEGPEAELGSLDPTVVGLPLLLMVVCFKFTSDLLASTATVLSSISRHTMRNTAGKRPRRRLAPSTGRSLMHLSGCVQFAGDGSSAASSGFRITQEACFSVAWGCSLRSCLQLAVRGTSSP